MNIEFTIKGDPKALKRHRTFRRGKFTGQYDPSQGDKADFLALAHQHAPEKPIDFPIRLRVYFEFRRPKNHYRSNGEIKPQVADRQHTTRPDVDNLCKFILDALNRVFWRDDCLVYSVEAEKLYGEVPATRIAIEWDEKLKALRKAV
jgi:Holliday junction resolvase RusA-like endonuclease